MTEIPPGSGAVSQGKHGLRLSGFQPAGHVDDLGKYCSWPAINRAPAAQVEPRIAEMAERLNIGDIWIKYPIRYRVDKNSAVSAGQPFGTDVAEYDAEHQQADGINDPDGNPRCFYRKLRRAHPVSSGRGNFYGAGKRRRWQERIFEKRFCMFSL